MRIYVTVKSVGKKKKDLTKQEIHLVDTPSTLRDFINQLVTMNVEAYHQKQVDTPWFPYLTSDEIESLSRVGKVGFGSKYNESAIDLSKAVNTAITAFEDGLFKVFISDEEIEELDTELSLHEGDEVAFIRFTMLSGRLW